MTEDLSSTHNSVRRRIVDHIQMTLSSIDGPPTYNLVVSKENVYRYGTSAEHVHDHPLIVIFHGSETKTKEGAPLGWTDAEMTVDLACYVEEGDGPAASDLLHDLYHDIEKALMADHTRGGLAIDTHIVGMQGLPHSDTLPGVAFEVNVRVDYQHGVTDPAVTTGG